MAELDAAGMGTARDYELKSLDLINSSGKLVPLMPQLVELEIHQSIDAPTMFGTLVLVDGQDIFNSFYINGNEILRVKIDQPSLNMPIEKDFKIFKVTDRKHNNNSGSMYVMHFCSPELVDSNSKAISKAYTGKRYSDIANDIFKNILKPKKINRVEGTTGAFDVIIPGYRPLEALNWLASRSYNGTSSTNFLFFENRDGYEFVSLQTLYAQKVIKNLVYDLKSVNDKPNSSSDIKRNRNSIEKIEILHDFDILATNNKGGFASKLMTVNLFNQEFKYYDYSLEKIQSTLLNKNMPVNDKSLVRSYFAFYKTHVMTSDVKAEKENAVDKWLMPRQMHSAMLDNFALRVVLPLDITTKAGDIVKIDMPKFVAADATGKKLDEFRTAKYLVRSVSHVFKQKGTGDTVLELVTDSFARAMPAEKVKAASA